MLDITRETQHNMPVYAGDPVVKFTQCNSIETHKFTFFHISLSNHTGTHIDFPAHVLKNGNTCDAYPLSHFSGDGVIVDLSDSQLPEVSLGFFDTLKLQENDIVFLKYGANYLDQNLYPVLNQETVNYLISIKIKIIGTESICIDNAVSQDLLLHKKFLTNNVLIIESLDMRFARSGRVKVFIFPLKLQATDGLPCRVGITYE
jgi:arylformamidase